MSNLSKTTPVVYSRKLTLKRITAIAMLFLFMAELAFSQTIYKWRDDKGKLHFGDSPPENTKAEIITTGNASIYHQEGLDQEIPKIKRSKTKTLPREQNRSENSACISAQQWAENVRSQLRQPHSAKRGDDLKKRMRAANKAVRNNC